MLYAVWVIDKGGLPIITREYANFGIDSSLVSGFVEALYTFALELGAKGIREIDALSFKLIIERNIDGSLIVIAVDKDDKPSYYEDFMTAIRNEILDVYEDLGENPAAKKIVDSVFDRLIQKHIVKKSPWHAKQAKIINNPNVVKLIKLMINGEIKKISPTTSKNTPGFNYSVAELVLHQDVEETIKTLDKLVDYSILRKKPVMSILTCQNRNEPVIVKLVCPKCNASALRQITIIEHFECGFIGELLDPPFARIKHCPNCGVILNKEGIEYIQRRGYICENCGSTIETPIVTYYCRNRGKTIKTDEATVSQIYEYELNEQSVKETKSLLASLELEEEIAKVKKRKKKMSKESSVQKEIIDLENQIKKIDEDFRLGKISASERDRRYISIKRKIRMLRSVNSK